MLQRVSPMVGAAAILIAAASAGAAPSASVVQRQTKRFVQASAKHDWNRLADLTYPTVIAAAGGRASMVGRMKRMAGMMQRQGLTVQAVTVGQPGRFYTLGKRTFVVVPSTTVMGLRGGKVIVRSYELGISNDGGKVWRFINGTGLNSPVLRSKVLPPLPAGLKLPTNPPQQFIRK